MLYIANPDTHLVDIYEGDYLTVRTTDSCLAPCCDIDCGLCDAETTCPHTVHPPGQGGMCVNRLVPESAVYAPNSVGDMELISGEFGCVGFYRHVPARLSCACVTAASCVHTAEREQLASSVRVSTGGRTAGLVRQRHFQNRVKPT